MCVRLPVGGAKKKKGTGTERVGCKYITQQISTQRYLKSNIPFL